MASTVEMCNSALNMLGASNIISLTEDSKNARLLNQRYVSARDAVFRSHNWNCLIKRVELAADTDVNEYDSLLQEAIAARLASELAYAITQSNSVMQLMQGIYENKIREARFMDATEGTADKLEANEFITARF